MISEIPLRKAKPRYLHCRVGKEHLAYHCTISQLQCQIFNLFTPSPCGDSAAKECNPFETKTLL